MPPGRVVAREGCQSKPPDTFEKLAVSVDKIKARPSAGERRRCRSVRAVSKRFHNADYASSVLRSRQDALIHRSADTLRSLERPA